MASSARSDKALWSGLFRVSPESGQTLQSQIRQAVVGAVLDRQMPANQPLPSCRTLADKLGVARGTVVLAYQQLVDQGFLLSKERCGHFVNPEALTARPEVKQTRQGRNAARPDWSRRIGAKLSAQANIVKPDDWQSFPYPFIYGQFDPSLFPTPEWRECSRMALGVREIRNWAGDMVDRDDPLLIEQIQARLLPRRGIFVRPEEIMLTLGAQNALYLVASLLMGQGTLAGIEEPGYPDARNILARHAGRLAPLKVDAHGLDPDTIPAGCDVVFATPSHQCPTTVSLPLERRRLLLERAARDDFLVVEDDYDSQLLDDDTPLPALKSLDESGRVIHLGSLSKTLAPGLRLGYVVAEEELIRELRALRRLMLRHPPANNQRAVALFLSLGHHDALIRRLTAAFAGRREALLDALSRHLPRYRVAASTSGTALWLEGDGGGDAALVARAARRRGVLIEPGGVFFGGEEKRADTMRLGISSIPQERIDAGVRELARAAIETETAEAA